MQSHGYVEAPEGACMLTWVGRGADVLLYAGRIGTETAEALKAEAQRRSATKVWFGHIAFASVLGLEPMYQEHTSTAHRISSRGEGQAAAQRLCPNPYLPKSLLILTAI